MIYLQLSKENILSDTKLLLVYHQPEQRGMVLKLLNILLPKHGMSYQTTLDWKIPLNNSKTLLIHGMVVHATVMLVDSFRA
jgi:hypothetical protein